MLEETYLKFKKNILPKMKKMQPNFQEPVVEYCEPEQVIDICSYNHYQILDKSSHKQSNSNDDNDIYDTSELEHEFEYGIYEDVLKTEQLMAELKRIDEAENENKKSRDVHFGDFPLEQFSDGGKVANEGDPQLKAAADTELYEIEKRAIQIDTEKYEHDNSSGRTDDTNSSQRAKNKYYSQRADDDDDDDENDILQTQVSHVQLPKNGEKYHDNHDENTLRKMAYGPTYVPYNEDGQKILLPQTTDMSRKDNLKLLYNSLPEGMCDNEYKSLEQAVNDVETFQYSHETSTKHVLVQGVYIGSASPLIADIKTQPYSMLTYLDNRMMTGTYDNTHDIPIYIDNGSTLNIMPTHFYDNAYFDPRRTMTDEEILRLKVPFDKSILSQQKKERLFKLMLENTAAFSIRDEIGTCPYFEVKLKLRDDKPFFVRPYNIREDQKPIIQKEMDRLEKLGIIRKGLTGNSSPVLLVKCKQQNLYRVVTDFRVLNERLVRVNHAFPIVRDCLEAIGASKCEVMSVLDLRDAYHTLPLAEESQKYCGLTPYYGSPTYVYLRMGMGMSCSPALWQQFVHIIWEQLPNKEWYKIIMDDILIFSTRQQHWEDLENLFHVLIKFGLKISPHKCQLF